MANFSIRAIPVLDPHGAIREWVGVHIDITEQREAEAELRESTRRSSATPTSSATTCARRSSTSWVSRASGGGPPELLMVLRDHPQGARIDEDITEALSFIQAAIVKMERLIAAILKLSREGRRRFSPEPLAMTPVIRGIADAQRHQPGEGCDGDGGRRSSLDRRRPARRGAVFGNLIDNALKYLDPARPGTIEVTARPAPGNRIRF